MGHSFIGNGRRSLVAALMLGSAVVGPGALAQSFGGMSMIDLEAARDSFFQSADHDGDFALSNEELMSAMGAANSDLFECWDDDGDGLCSYSEFLDSGLKVFNALDANGDGRLSPEEVQ
jgi:Ca2+-binding EF-hand superfamily protein